MKYPVYSEFKTNGAGHRSQLPVTWEMRRLKFIATCNDDALSETTDPDYELAYVDISSVSLEQGITTVEAMPFEKAPSRARRLVKDGDTIVSTVRTYLKAIAAIENPPENLVVSTGFAVIRSMPNVDSRYLAYALQSTNFIEAVVAHSSGVSYPAINPSELTCLPVTYPESTDEQRHIAAFLDWKTGQIDALLARKQALLDRLKEKRLAIITHAVTRGLNPDAPLRDSGIPWLGMIPIHWKIPFLKYRYDIDLGKMLDEKRMVGDNLLPYLRNTDVQWGSINFSELPQMDIAKHEYPRYTIQENDVLVCEGGEVGRAAVVGAQATVIGYQKALHRLRTQSTQEAPKFIYYTLLWAVDTGVFNGEGSSTIAHLTADQLRRYCFPCPPKAEQDEIVAFLDKRMTDSEFSANKIELAISRLTEYRTALITAATTGKIDLRNAKIPELIRP